MNVKFNNNLKLKDFYYYFNEQDANDKNNSKEKKFFNPHLNIQTNYTKNTSNVNLMSNMISKLKFIK